jgi:sugar/nucleoside kinase (ribokinase family)
MWSRHRDEGELVEWSRRDGYATVRMRRRPDGCWAVRLDLLKQAPDGPGYEQTVVDDRGAAAQCAAAMRASATVQS